MRELQGESFRWPFERDPQAAFYLLLQVKSDDASEELAAHLVREDRKDFEAEAAAFGGAVVCEVAPEEALEHTAAKFRWQRNACVGDGEHSIVVLANQRHLDAAAAFVAAHGVTDPHTLAQIRARAAALPRR